MTAKSIFLAVATTIGVATMVALAPTSASAQEPIAYDILGTPLALAETPFVIADALLGGPAYYRRPAYAFAAPAGVAVAGGADWIGYCSAKYRSFDPSSGTYLGYDGVRHYCQ